MDPDASPLTDTEYQALARFRRALRLFLAFSEDAARDHGLTPAHHQLLLAVRAHESAGRPPAIGELADHLQLRPHSTGELVDRACEHGLVERVSDPRDGRRSLVNTTPRGRQLLEELSKLHRSELRRFRSEMSDLLHDLDPPGPESPGGAAE